MLDEFLQCLQGYLLRVRNEQLPCQCTIIYTPFCAVCNHMDIPF